MSPPIDHLREGIQQLLAAATHRLDGFASDQLEDLVEGGCRLIRQYAVAGSVQIPGQDGDRWSLELRQEAERARRLLRAGHLRPETREELQRLVWALAARQETLFALLDFHAGPTAGAHLPAGTAPTAATPGNGADPFAGFPRLQHRLLVALLNKGAVPIKEVLVAVYGPESGDKHEALQQLKKRTNKKLATENLSYEIGYKGESLRLGNVECADDAPTTRRRK
jgi:hypothetical protein